jgi:hypothetical protein
MVISALQQKRKISKFYRFVPWQDLAQHHGIAIADSNSEKSKHNKVNRACLTHPAPRFLKVCLLHFNSVLDLQQSGHGRRLVFGF